MPRSNVLIDAVAKLATANDLPSLTRSVADAARTIAGADGATFVLMDGGQCYYVDEDAISPLWKGKKFPLVACISGWSMLNHAVAVIPDIYKDPRIPQDAYRPTFVKSLCMLPIRAQDPVGAIGVYWKTEHTATDYEVQQLQVLADCSATSLENLELKSKLVTRASERDDLTNRQKEIKVQLQSLTHDLRNPLAAILGFTDLLRTRSSSALGEKGMQYLANIKRMGDRMNRQVDRLRAIHRLSDLTVEKQLVDLSAIVKAIVDDMKSFDDERPVETSITPGLKAYADPELVRLALENLIINTFKSSGRTTTTWIGFDRASVDKGSEDSFVLEDRSEGPDAELAIQLIRSRAAQPEKSEFTGQGMGLASVVRILEMHGGRISAEPRSPQGISYRFSLPKHQPKA